MTYVISDLHGCPLEKFKELLEKAEFSDNDFLYILGDVIDRNGDGGVQMLCWLLELPNVQLILGNHEAMLLSCEFACSNSKTATSDTTANSTAPAQTEQAQNNTASTGNTLVAYFSRTGENYSVGNIEKGNTHIIADMIAEKENADTFEITTVNKYPETYDECTEVAKKEKDENARHELVGTVENMEQYDTIFIGYPIWWGDMPMAVYTFLEAYDFSGKTIIPFCTHEGSGISGIPSSIQNICPDAKVITDGFEIKGRVAQNSQDEAKSEVENWLAELK